MRYRHPLKMVAKHAGICLECNGAIEPGDSICWLKHVGAWHVDCKTAKLRHTVCTNCGGSGLLWNNAPCRACDGTGSREIQLRQQTQGAADAARCAREYGTQVSPPSRNAEAAALDVDRLYEDDCARQCGL